MLDVKGLHQAVYVIIDEALRWRHVCRPPLFQEFGETRNHLHSHPNN